MDKITLLPLLVFLLYSVTACASQNSEPSLLKKDLLGSWDCSFSFEENGSSITIESEDTYVRNGPSNSFGTLKVKFAEDLPEINYSMAGTATWEILDGFLVSTLTYFKIVNLSHPEFDEIFNLQEMFPTNISDSSEIIELTKSKLTLKSESSAQVYACVRMA